MSPEYGLSTLTLILFSGVQFSPTYFEANERSVKQKLKKGTNGFIMKMHCGIKKTPYTKMLFTVGSKFMNLIASTYYMGDYI